VEVILFSPLLHQQAAVAAAGILLLLVLVAGLAEEGLTQVQAVQQVHQVKEMLALQVIRLV
jgi:hypothetical protein